MNQVLAGGLALIIAFILWSSKKQSKGYPFFKSQKDSVSHAEENSSLIIEEKLIRKTESE